MVRADTKSQAQFEKWPLASQLLNFSTPGLQFRGNKARMSMKTKGRPRTSTTPTPILSKEGNSWLPSSGEEGFGGGGTLRPWRSLRLGVKPGFLP